MQSAKVRITPLPTWNPGPPVTVRVPAAVYSNRGLTFELTLYVFACSPPPGHPAPKTKKIGVQAASPPAAPTVPPRLPAPAHPFFRVPAPPSFPPINGDHPDFPKPSPMPDNSYLSSRVEYLPPAPASSPRDTQVYPFKFKSDCPTSPLACRRDCAVLGLSQAKCSAVAHRVQ
jgi:hypothetical protein